MQKSEQEERSQTMLAQARKSAANQVNVLFKVEDDRLTPIELNGKPFRLPPAHLMREYREFQTQRWDWGEYEYIRLIDLFPDCGIPPSERLCRMVGGGSYLVAIFYEQRSDKRIFWEAEHPLQPPYEGWVHYSEKGLSMPVRQTAG